MAEVPKKKKKKITERNVDNWNKRLKELIKKRASFHISRTTKSSKIITENRVYVFAEQQLTKFFGQVLAMLKAEILKNQAAVRAAPFATNVYDISYFDFSRSITDMEDTTGEIVEMQNVWEADITAAYYRAALNLGFISKKLYNICLKLPKHDRLRLMGSIATRKFMEEYKNGELSSAEIVQSDLLRDAWFKICSYVDMAMKTLKESLGENFLFYWVDGIYFYAGKNPRSNPFQGYVEMMRKHFHFDWKITRLEKFELVNMTDFLQVRVWKPGAAKPKLFFPKKEVVRGYYFADVKEFVIDMPAEKAVEENKRRRVAAN